MTQQSHPDAIAAIDAVLADTEQPVRAATAHSSRNEILADLQALRGHHKDLVTVLNATREALHLPADCDRNAIPAAAAEAHDAARNLAAQRDDLAARLDAERINTHAWATRAGLAQWDRDRLQRERDGLAADLRSAVRSLQEYAAQTARMRDTIATLRQIDRDATQLRADLDAGRLSDRLGEPAPAGLHVTRGCGPGDLEAGCPCAKAPCGSVDTQRTDPTCDQHPPSHGRTMRQMHRADRCPAQADPDAGLADALERAESALIDRDDSVWRPRPDGRWQTRYLDVMARDEIEDAFGPTRAVLLVDIDDEGELAAPVPPARAQEPRLEPIRPATWEQHATDAIQAALADTQATVGTLDIPLPRLAAIAVEAIVDAWLVGPGGRCRRCGDTYPRTLPAGQDPLCGTCDSAEQTGPFQAEG